LSRPGPYQMQEFQREAFRYTPYFCEENIWWLAKSLPDSGADTQQMKVLLFTNPSESVALLNQRAAPSGRLITWDYHLVLQAGFPEGVYIFDLDTRLFFPSPVKDYLRNTFPPQATLPERYRAWVRSIPADTYLRRFSSDRSHMTGVVAQSEFPDYPPILAPQAKAIDLSAYRDITRALDDGSQVERLPAFFPYTA